MPHSTGSCEPCPSPFPSLQALPTPMFPLPMDYSSAWSSQLPRTWKRGGEEPRHSSQHPMCSLELAWAERWDATLANGNAQLQTLPLKKNSSTLTPWNGVLLRMVWGKVVCSWRSPQMAE